MRRPDRRALLRRVTRQETPPSTCSARSRCSRRRGRRARGGSCSRPRAAGCTATPTCFPRPKTTRSDRWRPYGQGKYAAEGYGELYQRLHGLSTVSLRYGNVYGPRQDVHGEAGVVAIFCGHLIDGRDPTVFGDGRQTRDWVDVSDVVRANLVAAESELTGPVNIAQGRETAVLELLAALDEVSDGVRCRRRASSPSGSAKCGAAASTSPGPGVSSAGRRKSSCRKGCAGSWLVSDRLRVAATVTSPTVNWDAGRTRHQRP